MEKVLHAIMNSDPNDDISGYSGPIDGSVNELNSPSSDLLFIN